MAKTRKDWKRVGEAIAIRRGQLGITRQEDAAKRANVSEDTWRKLEQGIERDYRPNNLAAISVVLDWPADMIARIADGEDPFTNEAPATWRRSIENRLKKVEQLLVELTEAVKGQ